MDTGRVWVGGSGGGWGAPPLRPLRLDTTESRRAARWVKLLIAPVSRLCEQTVQIPKGWWAAQLGTRCVWTLMGFDLPAPFLTV